MKRKMDAPRLYAFQAGGDVADVAISDPFDPEVGKKEFSPWFVYVVVHPEGNVLFDTGIHPQMVTDPRSRLGAFADLLEARMKPGDDIVSQLASIGLEPHDISVVVASHLHFDHVDALELFRHARIVVQRSEYAFAHNPAVYQSGAYVPSAFAGEFEWQLIGGPLDVFDDGLIELIPTPGHTPGHQSMLVNLAGGKVLVLGDVTYQMDKMRERLLPAILWNPEAMVASWELIEWLSKREDAVMLCSHDREFESRVRLGPGSWYE
ncbi:MAG: N-acyl homoserine lactonase family protein [Solirubrobacterales bacterium]